MKKWHYVISDGVPCWNYFFMNNNLSIRQTTWCSLSTAGEHFRGTAGLEVFSDRLPALKIRDIKGWCHRWWDGTCWWMNSDERDLLRSLSQGLWSHWLGEHKRSLDKRSDVETMNEVILTTWESGRDEGKEAAETTQIDCGTETEYVKSFSLLNFCQRFICVFNICSFSIKKTKQNPIYLFIFFPHREVQHLQYRLGACSGGCRLWDL